VTAGVAARRGARGIALAAAIVLVALNLRAFLTSTGPLLDDIRAASGLGFHGAALLTALPMLAMGPMSLIGVAVGQRRGERAGILWGLATIALACLSRVAGQSAAVLMGSAVLAGLGVGLVQALMPLVIKKAFPVRMGMAMGLYSAALMAGGGLGAMGSPWMARLSGAWQAGLAVWALPAVIALAAWSLVTPREAKRQPTVQGRRGAWRACIATPRAWLLAAYFGLVNGGYTSVVAWLPQHYAQLGWSHEQSGALLALMTVAQLLAALAMPALARGRRDLRPWLALMLLAQLAGFAGLLLNAPATTVVGLLGVGLGGAFSLSMVLALDHSPRPEAAGMLAAFMQGAGFMIAALAPFITGAMREWSGGFGMAWTYLGVVVLMMLPLTLCFDPRGYARATAKVGLLLSLPAMGRIAHASRT
jgi:CP family cyanate transporter-like MFS transporter